MKLRLRTYSRTAVNALLVVALLALSACGGSSKTAPDLGPEHEITANVIPVKMRPQQPVDPPFTGFALQVPVEGAQAAAASAPRRSSFSWGELHLEGAAFNPGLPNNRVAPDPQHAGAALFTPQYDNATGLEGAAYALYDFMLPGYASSGEEQTLGFGLLLPAVQRPHVWVGLANFARGRWDWFQFPADDVLSVGDFTPYQNGAGKMIIAVLSLGLEQFSLNFVSVGKLEERGIGDLGAAPAGLFTMLPNFSNILFLPEVVDLSPDCAPINDQGGIGSCTAFANVDGAYNYELGQTYGGYGWDFTDAFNRCSPRFVYNQTGVDLGGSCPTGGRTTNDVGTWLLTNGTATELNAPYGSLSASLYNCGTTWSAAALTDASLLVPDSKTFIGTDIGGGNYRWTDSDIAIAKNVLKNLRHVIVFRTYLDSNFQGINYASGATWEYNGSSIGGHAMCIVGYNTGLDGGTGAFKVRNSWGTDFGDDGYCWISFDSFRSNTAGVYGYYLDENCDSNVINRFTDNLPFFWICRFWINLYFVDRIVLNWEPDPRAVRYAIYRDQLDQPIGTAKEGESMYEDFAVEDTEAHVYWIVGIDADGNPSSPSKPAVGWKLPSPG